MNNLDQVIDVNAFYFPGGSVARALPRTIEWQYKRYTFNDGLQYLVKKGNELVRLFDMSDGQRIFRLRLEHDEWTLVNVRPVRALA